LMKPNGTCKPSWETRHEFKEDGVPEGDYSEGPSFLCADSAYAFPFEEFLNLGWTNLRKLWLDGNFLSGSIPSNIGSVWPKLRSLDLYDNNLEGPIPESLGTLNFHKLQLQANHLNGEIPASVVKFISTRPMIFGVSENQELTGCIPEKHWKVGDGTAGTQLRSCGESGVDLVGGGGTRRTRRTRTRRTRTRRTRRKTRTRQEAEEEDEEDEAEEDEEDEEDEADDGEEGEEEDYEEEGDENEEDEEL